MTTTTTVETTVDFDYNKTHFSLTLDYEVGEGTNFMTFSSPDGVYGALVEIPESSDLFRVYDEPYRPDLPTEGKEELSFRDGFVALMGLHEMEADAIQNLKLVRRTIVTTTESQEQPL